MRKYLSKNKQSSTSSLRQPLLLLVVFLSGCFFTSTILLHTYPLHQLEPSSGDGRNSNNIHDQSFIPSTFAKDHNDILSKIKPGEDTSRRGSPIEIQNQNEALTSSTILHDKRILIALASFDFSQFPLLEEVLDAYQDLCFAGASKVDIYIYTTIPYTVALIDLLNTRLDCQTLQIYIVVKSPALRLNLVDCHRTLFYEKIDEYDLFIYSEDDILVKPTTVATYLLETRNLEKMLQKSPAEDYNIGIVRYEYNYPPDVVINDKTRHATENVTRVYWEHLWKPLVPKSVHPPSDIIKKEDEQMINENYVTMDNAHQGMFLATAQLLRAWRDRPGCQFDVIRQRPGTKKNPGQPSEGTQRVWMSSRMLHGKKHCNVKQLIPIRNFGQVTLWHLPNKNYRRVGKKGRIGGTGSDIENEFGTGKEKFVGPDPGLPTAMQLHMEMRKNYGYPGEDSSSRENKGKSYNGIKMINEVDLTRRFKGLDKYTPMLDKRMQAFDDFVARGGRLTDNDYADWKWTLDRE